MPNTSRTDCEPSSSAATSLATSRALPPPNPTTAARAPRGRGLLDRGEDHLAGDDEQAPPAGGGKFGKAALKAAVTEEKTTGMLEDDGVHSP
jgi:hypothetical protein